MKNINDLCIVFYKGHESADQVSSCCAYRRFIDFFSSLFSLLAERACVLIAASSADSFSFSSFLSSSLLLLFLSFATYALCFFFVSPLFSLFFPPFWLPASSPFFSPVFLSSRLFALSLFFILFLPPLFLQFRHLRVIVSTCELLFKGVRVIQLQMTSLAVVPWLCIHTKAHGMQQVTASSPP